jgi:hypothetical protein
MRPRIEQELSLMREHYGDVAHAEAAGDDWFRLPRYLLGEGWRIGEAPVTEIPIVFFVTGAHPGAVPYGFLAPAGLNFKGTAPGSTGAPPKTPPFDGAWMHFSWSVENWAATSDIRKGSNLLAWARSFAHRFKEGA